MKIITNRDWKLFLLGGVALLAIGINVPAHAQNRHDQDREHQQWNRQGPAGRNLHRQYDRYGRRTYPYRYWREPSVVYAPPVIYAPPPDYYESPGFNLIFPLQIR